MPHDLPLPSLTGQIPYDVEEAIERLRDHSLALAGAQDTVRDQLVADITATQDALARLQDGRASLLVATLETKQITVSGVPLTGLLVGTHVLRPSPSQENQLFWETDRQHLYYTEASGSGFVWTVMPLGEMRGTLSPDQKPTDLGTADEGFRFFSTDFFRSYRWTGAAWLDTGDELSRRSIVWFDAAPEPTTGWQLCDGTATTRSTSTGGTAAYTAPDLTGSNRFLRAVAGATGGTGGTATTHTHPVNPPNTTSSGPSSANTGTRAPGTGTPSATQVVQSGAGVTVASSTHIHTVDSHNHSLQAHDHDTDIAQFNSGTPSGASGIDALPPFYEANPYVRL